MKHLLAAVLGTVLVAGSAPAAAPAGFLANQGKLKPVVSIANSYSEKVVRIFAGDVGSAAVFDVVPNPEKVSARVVARLGDYNFAGITADTVVAFAAGDFNFRATLAEAATRTIAATGSATFNFSLQIPVLDADGNPRLDANENEMFSTVRLGSMKWTWNASTKMVSATLALVIPAGGIPDTAGVGGIACAKFAGLAGEGGVRRFANVPLAVTVGFGDATGSRDVFVGGVTQTRLVQAKGVAADHPDTFPVTAVVLAGAADTRAPQLTVRMPSKVEAGTEAAIFGVLVDRPAPSGYSTPGALGYGEPEVAVYVNQVPGEGVDPDFVLGYSDNRGTALAEDAPGLNAKGTGYLAGETGSLGAGTQTLRFVATDSEGNTSTLVKSISAPVPIPAMHFTRVTDAVAISGSTQLGVEATFEAVFQLDVPENPNGDANIYAEHWAGAGSPGQKQLVASSAGVGGFAAPSSNFNGGGLVKAQAVSLGQWHHVAFVANATSENLYLDGRRVATRPSSGADIWETTTSCRLGLEFLGYLSSFRISNVARYTGTGYTVPPLKLVSDQSTVLLYNFSNIEGDTVPDESGNGRTGTIGGPVYEFPSITKPTLETVSSE